MASFQLTLENIIKSQRDIDLLNTQNALQNQIDIICQTQTKTLDKNNQSDKNAKALRVLQKKLDYYIGFKEIYKSIESDRKSYEQLRKKIRDIEYGIREKYRKLEDDEIKEKTQELKKEVEYYESKINQTLLKPSDCIHCDVNGIVFDGIFCFMCGQTIRFLS